MAEVSNRLLLLLMGVSFASGVFLGYEMKTWRMKYLQTKRDYLQRRLRDTQKQIDVAVTS